MTTRTTRTSTRRTRTQGGRKRLPADVTRAVRAALDVLRDLGAELVDVSLPHTRYALPVYYIVAPAEASANLARYNGVRYGLHIDGNNLWDDMELTRGAGFGPEVRRRIMLGTYALSSGYYDAYYKKAQQVRRLLTNDYLKAFAEVDAMVTPTAPTPAFKIGEKTDDPVAMYLADIYTVTANLAGICRISVPFGTSSEGLPIGVHILGKHFGEATVLRVGRTLET